MNRGLITGKANYEKLCSNFKKKKLNQKKLTGVIIMENVILKSEEEKTRSEIVSFLREIATKIDSGVVKLVQGESTVELNIPENLQLELKVEEKIKEGKPQKMQLEIELEWYVGSAKESIRLG
jgi:amphi-Trp domain-containing protein